MSMSPLISDEQLGRITDHYQLPRPTTVRPVGNGWVHTNLAIGFAPETRVAPLLLRLVRTETGRDTLHRELAGLVLARNASLPIVDRYQILPDGLMPVRGALMSFLPGQPLAMLKDHARFIDLCAQAGEVAARLGRIRIPHFGTSPTRQTFLPTAPSWRREWESHIGFWLGLARRTGELSSLLDDVEAALRDRLDVLDSVQHFSLVHGDLHSGNLLAGVGGGEARITGLLDWDSAMAGDHLIDVAMLLNAPSAALAAIARGYGRDRFSELRDPEVTARLEVYSLTHILVRIGATTFPPFQPSALQALSLCLAEQHGRQALAADGVRGRIEEALAGTGSRMDPKPEPVRMLVRRALHTLVSGPPLRADQYPDLLLPLASATLAHRTSGTVAEAFLALGHGSLDALGTAPARFHTGSSATEAEISRRIFESVLGREAAGMSTAISVLAAIRHLLTTLEIEPNVHFWSGASALLESLLVIEEHTPVSGVGALAHALMGLDAAILVGAPAAVISKFGSVLLDFPGIDAGTDTGEAARFAGEAPPPGVPRNPKGKSLMPLVLAMARLEEGQRLYPRASTVLKQLGFLDG